MPMTRDELQALFSRIPTEPTCCGCHECAIRCSGAIPVARCEWEDIAAYIAEHLSAVELESLLAQDKRFEIADGVWVEFCILYDVVGLHCAVYPVRPLVCRLLGHVEFMPCPLSRVPSVLPDGPEIMRRYAQLERRTLAEWLAADPPRRVARGLRPRGA